MTDQKERGFDWLPDYREIIACQEPDFVSTAKRENDKTGNPTALVTEKQPFSEDKEISALPLTAATSGGEQETFRVAGRSNSCRKVEDCTYAVNEPVRAEASGSSDGSSSMLPPEELAREEEFYWKDYEYITRLLPLTARECWAAADAVLDRYEYEDSAIYLEYPDKTTIRRIADTIYEMMHYVEERPSIKKNDGSEAPNPYYVSGEAERTSSALKDMIFTMTAWNISYRRQRYQRRRKVFPAG